MPLIMTGVLEMDHGGIIRNSGINLISTKNGLLINNSLSRNQHGIFLKYCNDNITVRQNNISNNRQEGIFQWECSKIYYLNNTIAFNQYSGVFFMFGTNSYCIDNYIANNSGSGIYLYGGNCNDHHFHNNSLVYNNANGIQILGGKYNNVSYNEISGNLNSGVLIEGDFNIIDQNVIANNSNDGILIQTAGNANEITQNSVKGNYGNGIHINDESDYNYIYNNTIELNQNSGVLINQKCENNIIYFNKIKKNVVHGVRLTTSFSYVCYLNNITENKISQNGGHGISLTEQRNCTILNNQITSNLGAGIRLADSKTNFLINNNITGNNGHGIHFSDFSHSNIIKDNEIRFHNAISGPFLAGIYIYHSMYNQITTNLISNNDQGIYFYINTDQNVIYKNRILDNMHHGAYIHYADYNLFYYNTFVNNTDNVIDLYSHNYWNNSLIGNYWDDYGGFDLNDDDIGDTPYIINVDTSSEDSLPIYYRFDILSVRIILPNQDDVFGHDSPEFLISCNEINSSWYTLDNGAINITFTGLSGKIDQVEWEKKGDGTVSIRFYVNNSVGNILFSDIVLVKDLITPIVNINNPSENQFFSTGPPNYNITITESNLDSYWYTLDDGATNITITSLTGTIDQSEWNKHGNGTVTLRFHAKDEAKNEGFTEITVRKDINSPLITIHTPNTNNIFGLQSPQYNISIDEINIDMVWYTLDGGIITLPLVEYTSVINQTEWDKIENGTATITFYANDSAGNLGQASVSVHKDILGPIIIINTPQDDAIFGYDAPNFDLTIVEFNLDSMWYSLDYGLTTIPLSSFTGTIDQVVWEGKGSETVIIRFYANDSSGHESFIDVTIIKDIALPLIIINSPGVGDMFGATPPDYNITINETNLNSHWYTVDGGVTNITISNFTGTIDQIEWDKNGNGTVNLRFYARDEGGNEGFAEIIIRKEIIAPVITINSPLLNDIYSSSSPSYSLVIFDPNLDHMWYSLDGGATIIFFTELTGTIEQLEWNKRSNGTVRIRFYANDTLGNENYQEVILRKDISGPIITVNSPVLNDIFGHDPPNYEITVIDSQLDSMWYTIDDGLTNISITNPLGTIEQTEWEKKGGGNILIRFYANDTLGNTAYSEVIIIKDVLYGIDHIVLFTPSAYSHISSNLLNFSWSSLDAGFGAVNFTIQVSNTANFGQIIFQSENIAETLIVTNYSVLLSITTGQYYWRVRSTYENYNGSWSDYSLFTLYINNYAPNLALDECTPSTGTKITIFKITVIYSDLDNNAPDYVEILINGSSYRMEKLNPSDIDYIDGCVYLYLTLLAPSTTAYSIAFECFDGTFQYSTSTYQGPLVESDSTPNNNQGDNNLNSTNIFAITMIIGIPIGILLPLITFAELKVRKMKLGGKPSTKIKKKGIKS